VVEVTRLLIAYTPYHVLLATAAVRACPAQSNHLIVVNDFEAAADIAAALDGVTDCPYDSVSVCGGTFGVTSRVRRQFHYRRALPEIQARAKTVAPQEIWVGNDARPESQAAFRAAGTSGQRAVGVYIEDGLTAYADSVKRPLTLLEAAAGRLLFGQDWSGIAVLGTSGRMSRGMFIFPALVRRELRRLEQVEIPRQAVLDASMQQLAARLIERSGADVARLRRVDAIVAVSHSSVASRSSGYQPGLISFIRQLTANGCTVGVKYHPRQAEADYLGLAQQPEVVVLPQGLALEYLYVFRGSRGGDRDTHPIRFVVGDVSTILLTARWLAPEACCISLARPLKMLDQSLEVLFNALGVQLPATLDAFPA
jgi:hypothetical protein